MSEQSLTWLGLAVLQELLNGSSRDPSAAVRQAARAALSELPLTALSLRPLFTTSEQAACGGEVDTPAHKTRRRSKAESSIKQAAEGLDLLELAGLLLLLLLLACISLPHTLITFSAYFEVALQPFCLLQSLQSLVTAREGTPSDAHTAAAYILVNGSLQGMGLCLLGNGASSRLHRADQR